MNRGEVRAYINVCEDRKYKKELREERGGTAHSRIGRVVGHGSAMPPPRTVKSEAQEEAGISKLRVLLDESTPAGLDRLVHAYGSAQRCFACYLRAGDKENKYDPCAAAAAISDTLTFRKEMGLDLYSDGIFSVNDAFEAHPLRSRLPLAFAGFAPDGCVIQYARVASVKLCDLAMQPQNEIKTLVSLWLEQALRLQGESTRKRESPCPGTYDVYDMKGVNLWSLLWDAKESRHTLGPILSMGEKHYPENLCKCFVINAGSLFSGIWTVVKPFLSQRTQDKVKISTNIPKELTDALGGEEHVAQMMSTVPPAPA